MPLEIIISLVIFALIITSMAVGVLLGKSPLKGSCGGKGGPDCVCDEFERLKCEARDRMFARRKAKST
jgi:hypothetical protein